MRMGGNFLFCALRSLHRPQIENEGSVTSRTLSSILFITLCFWGSPFRTAAFVPVSSVTPSKVAHSFVGDLAERIQLGNVIRSRSPWTPCEGSHGSVSEDDFHGATESNITGIGDRSHIGFSGKRPQISSMEYLMRRLHRTEDVSKLESLLSDVLGNPHRSSWPIRDQIDFIKYLASRKVARCILLYVDGLRGVDHNNSRTDGMVKVYTTALFSIASVGRSTDKDTSSMAWNIMDNMARMNVEPTSLTLVALLQNIRQGPAAAQQAVDKITTTYPQVRWDAEVYHAAIYAARSKQIGDEDHSWQMALQLMQQMQHRPRIYPTTKTYLAVLEVLADSGKIPMIRSITRQWRSAAKNAREEPNKELEDKIWAISINACARMGDFRQAAEFLKEIPAPNLRHWTGLLKAFANAGQDQLAIDALNLMTRANQTEDAGLCIPGGVDHLVLPRIDPDMIALNTVLSAAAKAGNYDAVRSLFDRIQNGSFVDPAKDNHGTRQFLSPDRISYHTLLLGCNDPKTAKQIIKDMRLSRRNRYGVIPPTSVSYARALQVCQRSRQPDLDTANLLLQWAKDDQLKLSVHVFASAMCTAMRCGNNQRCIELYEEMKEMKIPPNDVALNGVLSALCGLGDEERSMEFFEEMKANQTKAFASSLRRLVNLVRSNLSRTSEEKEANLLHVLSYLDDDERRLNIGSSVFEALITFYGSKGKIDKVLEVQKQINGSMDAPCLRAILLAYTKSTENRWEEAVELLHTSDIIEGAPGPGLMDQVALSHVIVACAKASEFATGLSILQLYGIPAHQLPVGASSVSIGSLNALIAACGRGGCPEMSLALLNDMKPRLGIRPDRRSYRSAVIACNQAQHGKMIYGSDDGVNCEEEDGVVSSYEWWEIALSLLDRMKGEGLTPDVQTYSSVISACEAAGQWQRALGVLQSIIDDEEHSLDSTEDVASLNLYCWNAAISACEKGGAWLEALDLFERMLEIESITPNIVTMNSLLEALEKNGQKELANSKYVECLELGIVNPWRRTNKSGEHILALDFHRFSSAMTKVALRNVLDTWLDESDASGGLISDLVIITGKGLQRSSEPVLRRAVTEVLIEYGIEARMDQVNTGRIIIDIDTLLECFENKSWE